jgi:hypothetical protein
MATNPNVQKVLDVARSEGFIPASDKDAKVSGRVHRSLLDAAKQRTGLTSETALLEYALAKVAIEDNFHERFARLRGSVSREVDLEF